MTISSGALGGTVGLGGMAAGGSNTNIRHTVAQLASTGTGHISETIALAVVLLVGGVAALGLARRHQPVVVGAEPSDIAEPLASDLT